MLMGVGTRPDWWLMTKPYWADGVGPDTHWTPFIFEWLDLFMSLSAACICRCVVSRARHNSRISCWRITSTWLATTWSRQATCCSSPARCYSLAASSHRGPCYRRQSYMAQQTFYITRRARESCDTNGLLSESMDWVFCHTYSWLIHSLTGIFLLFSIDVTSRCCITQIREVYLL